MARPVALSVLVVDDEDALARVVGSYLEREGYHVTLAADGVEALAAARDHHPDLVVLDLMLPGMDGFEVCRQLRTFSDAYVIMLTARGEETDRVVGLAVGADDYVVKPFSPRELVARVKAMQRRPRMTATGASLDSIHQLGELMIDMAAREVSVADRGVELTRTEFDLLVALANEPRSVFERDHLLRVVRGSDWFGDSHVVDVHIANLRRKLGDDPASPRFVVTVRGVGYRLGTGAVS